MDVRFTSEFFAGNRQRLRELFTGTAPIVVTANGLLQRSGDNNFRFQQDANFWYLTGIDEPDVVLVMDRDQEYLIMPTHSVIQERFDGVATADSLRRSSGVKKVLEAEDGWRQFEARLKKVKHVATLPANLPYIAEIGMYTNPARASLIAKLKDANPALELLDLREHMIRMRVIKQPVEIAAIQKAVDITCQAFAKVQKQKFKYEYELEAELLRAFRRKGAESPGYDSIVAGGERALTLHYTHNNQPLNPEQLVLVDAGAQYSHYNADITRTWSMTKPSPRQAAVVEAVNEVLEFGLEQLKPGLSFAQAEQNLRQFMGEKLRALGLIKSIDKEAIHKFYPHAPHYLGLDVHDAGDYHQLLQPGMVLTLEPGIYIPREGIGVRIEEDILITAGGYKLLSAKLPRILS